MKAEQPPGLHFILVLSRDSDRIAWVREAMKEQAVIVDAHTDGNSLLQQITDADARVLIVDCSAGNQSLIALAEEAMEAYPTLQLVGMGKTGDHEALVTAMRIKAVDFVQFEAAPAAVVGALGKLLGSGPGVSRHRRRGGKIITVVSGHTNAGASTFAANLAFHLARNTDNPDILLLDFGTPAGDCLTYLGMPARLTFTEGLQNLARCDRQYLRNGVAHQAGISALPLFADPSELRFIRPADAFQFLGLLSSHYGLIVADIGGGENGPAAEYLLRHAEQIVVVAEQSITSVLALQALLPKLSLVTRPSRPPALVVNRYDSAVGLSSEYLAKTLGVAMWGVLPERRAALLNATNSGQLVAAATPRDPWVKALDKIAERV